MRKRSYQFVAVLIGLSVLVSGCHSKRTVETKKTVKEQVVQTTAPQTMTIYDLGDGNIEVPYLSDYPKNDYDWNQLFEKNGYKYYKDTKHGQSKLGIDVSRYQGDIDWSKVKNAGIDYVMIRLGFRGYGSGKLVLDTKYEQNIKGAIDAGLDVGVYFFSQAISEDEAREEAEFVHKYCKEYKVTYPVVMDTEVVKDDTSRTENMTEIKRTEVATAFQKQIKAYGYDFMLYANAKWLTTCMDLSKMKKWDIWYADYQERPQIPYAFKMWQYTESGTVPGVTGKVDLNIYWEK